MSLQFPDCSLNARITGGIYPKGSPVHNLVANG